MSRRSATRMRRAAAGRVAQTPTGPTKSFQGAINSSADGTSHTFSAFSLGAAAADRLILVGFGTRRGAATAISSVTIGGVTATLIQTQRSDSGVVVNVCLAYAVVPTGTTGDIVINWSATATRVRGGVWRAVGLNSSTPIDTGTSTATPPTDTLNTDDDGFAFGVVAAGVSSGAGGSVAWTNLSEDFDAVQESNVVVSGASSATVDGTLAVTGTVTSDNATPAPCGAFATFA